MAREFLHEIDDTLDRQAADGRYWCPQDDRDVLRNWTGGHSEDFNLALYQVVRLVRAMQLAEGDYVGFLYLRFEVLRTSLFRAAFNDPVVQRRLKGTIEVSQHGLTFLEPAMATEDKSFDLEFVQMPRLAALLDILHAALGFEPVRTALLEVTEARADDPVGAARALSSGWNAWLKGRVKSAHYSAKADHIRGLLEDADKYRSSAIDNAFVLTAWQALSLGKLDGFILLRSAARSVIRYRQSLRIAESERQVGRAAPLGGAGEAGALDVERTVVRAVETNDWSSPLVPLTTPPINEVKWFKDKDKDPKLLFDFLGPSAGEDAEKGALFGPDAFDLKFGTTLLRCNIFGDLQNRLVNGTRSGPYAENEWEDATVLDNTGYRSVIERYREVTDEATRVIRAAAVILLRARDLGALQLLAGDPSPAVAAWLAGLQEAAGGARTKERLRDIDAEGGNVVPLFPRHGFTDAIAALAAAVDGSAPAEPGTREVVKLLTEAIQKFTRKGFAPKDRVDPENLEVLRAGIEPMLVLNDRLLDLQKWFDANGAKTNFEQDREVILAHLKLLHGPG